MLDFGYLHSSAAFYELNLEHPKIKITHYKDVGIKKIG